MMKLYVKEIITRDVDDRPLITVKTYNERPHKYSYLIFL